MLRQCKTRVATLLFLLVACIGLIFIGGGYYNFRYNVCVSDKPNNFENDVSKYIQSVHLLIPKGIAVPPSEAENVRNVTCSFSGGDPCSIERDMHRFVQRFLPRNSVVMEIGARYGSTSCVIAHVQGNTGRLLAVEPDIRVIPYLVANQASHFCNFQIVAGAVTEKPSYRDAGPSLDFRTRISAMNGTATSNMIAVPNFSWESVEQILGLKVDTLVMDCEGCEIPFLEEYFGRKHPQLKAILVEWHADLPKHLLTQWLDTFKKVGFTVMANMINVHNYLALTKGNP